jgi:hypothetical protein
VVLFGLCVAASVRVMPAYKFGPSGFVRRSLVFCDFTYLCSLSFAGRHVHDPILFKISYGDTKFERC